MILRIYMVVAWYLNNKIWRGSLDIHATILQIFENYVFCKRPLFDTCRYYMHRLMFPYAINILEISES